MNCSQKVCSKYGHGLMLAAGSFLVSLLLTGTSHAQWQKDGEFVVSSASLGVPNPMPANSNATSTVNGYSTAPSPWPETSAPTAQVTASTSQPYSGISSSAGETVVHKFKWVGADAPSTPNVEIKFTLAVSATSNAESSKIWGATSSGTHPVVTNPGTKDVTETNRAGSAYYVSNPADSSTSHNYVSPSQTVKITNVALGFSSGVKCSFSSSISATTCGYNLGPGHSYGGGADATEVVAKINGVSQ